MRDVLIRAACLLLFAFVASADDKPPDISGESEASLHRYVDRPVVVRGRFSMRGKVAPFINTGKTQIYIKCDDPPDLDSTLEGKEMILVGTLHYQPEMRSADPARAGIVAYFYIGGDCAFLKPGAI
jgi:hypothetical protein